MEMSFLTMIGVGILVVLAVILLWPRGETRRVGMGNSDDQRPLFSPRPSAREPAPAPEGMDHDFGMRLYDLVANGRRVEAHGELRSRMQMTAEQADGFIKRIEAQQAAEQVVRPPRSGQGPLAHLRADQAAQIDEMLDRGRKLEAIKMFREWSGVGLRQAKEAVEAYERRR